MVSDFSWLMFIKDTYPISTISLVVFFSAFLKASLVNMFVLRQQNKRIEYLEKQFYERINKG